MARDAGRTLGVWLVAGFTGEGDRRTVLEFDQDDPPVLSSGQVLTVTWGPGGVAVVTAAEPPP